MKYGAFGVLMLLVLAVSASVPARGVMSTKTGTAELDVMPPLVDEGLHDVVAAHFRAVLERREPRLLCIIGRVEEIAGENRTWRYVHFMRVEPTTNLGECFPGTVAAFIVVHPDGLKAHSYDEWKAAMEQTLDAMPHLAAVGVVYGVVPAVVRNKHGVVFTYSPSLLYLPRIAEPVAKG